MLVERTGLEGSAYADQAVLSPQLGDGKRRKSFGRDDLDLVYRVAKDSIVRNKVFRLCQYEEVSAGSHLTICNLWRIVKSADGSIQTYEFDLRRGEWLEVAKSEYWHWPKMPFSPITMTQSLDWWRDVSRAAIWKCLIAAGYQTLPRFQNEITEWGRDAKGRPTPVAGRREMNPRTMADLLLSRYLGRHNRASGTWKDGLLQPHSMQAGARALRAAFFQHIVDAEVMSALGAIDFFRVMTLQGYLPYAVHRNGLLKVATEHRNLLPILEGINPEHWGRADLFSKRVWVKDGRKSTAIDRKPLRVDVSPGRRYRSFEHAAAWKWLNKAPLGAVREWSINRDISVISNLALANVSARIPVIALSHVIRASRTFSHLGVSEQVQIVYRLFLLHVALLWKDIGYEGVKMWLRLNHHSNLSIMYDYLAREGFAHGLPDRNSTWQSLCRRSDDWHERIAIENASHEGGGYEWETALAATTIDEIEFTPLTSSKDLAKEGYELRHCVGSYDDYCHAGGYRVYAVLEPNGERSTLGIRIEKRRVEWDQHMSKFNGSVSHPAAEAGRRLVEMYGEAMRTAAKTKELEGK